MPNTVVIGYGNELRGDDAIGPVIARTVDGWHLPGVRGIALHQLTPEVAATLADLETALFVDASVDGHGVSVLSLAPAGPESATAHVADPARLLGLAASVYGHSPRAWEVTVPAQDLSLGEHLSPAAEDGVAEALERIQALLCLTGGSPTS